VGLLHEIFKKGGEEVELPVEELPIPEVTVRVENLKDFVDIDRIVRLLKDGNVIILKTKDLQRRDLGEFQNSVQKLKRISGQYGFDIAGTEEGYIVLTPTFAKIAR